jgi:hypothetical protein
MLNVPPGHQLVPRSYFFDFCHKKGATVTESDNLCCCYYHAVPTPPHVSHYNTLHLMDTILLLLIILMRWKLFLTLTEEGMR